jgi:tetratricopeptide (TPR) repeat protein
MSPQVHALVQEADMLRRHGNVAEAVRRCRKALRLEPGNIALSALMGALLAEQGEFQQAARFLGKVAAERPHDADMQFNLGVVFQGQGRHEEALERLRASLALNSESADVLAAMALSLQELGRPDEAVAQYRRALEIDPHAPRAHNDLGNALQDLGNFEEALGHYRAALAAAPKFPLAHNNLGNALSALGRYDEAMESYRRALDVDPADADAHYYLGLTQLLLGNYAAGWTGYEYRLRRPERGKPRSFGNARRWLGDEDLNGKSILLHVEQGLGDTIQFARYAPLVAAKGARVMLEVYAPLAPLLAKTPGVSQVIIKDQPVPACDFHCPLPSLPLAFGTTLATIPPVVRYGERQAPGDGALRVGVCWRGNAQYAGDRHRSLPVNAFEPLLRIPGIEFVSLLKDLSEEETQVTRRLPNFTHHPADFAGTASLIRSLDLVITIDTAWGPWSACVGTPAWVLVNFAPHWVWGVMGEDSAWYPGLRLFRQAAPGEWIGVLQRAQSSLEALRDAREAA